METTIEGLGFRLGDVDLINEHPPLYRDYNRNHNLEASKRRGFINQGSTLELKHGSSQHHMPKDPGAPGSCPILTASVQCYIHPGTLHLQMIPTLGPQPHK